MTADYFLTFSRIAMMALCGAALSAVSVSASEVQGRLLGPTRIMMVEMSRAEQKLPQSIALAQRAEAADQQAAADAYRGSTQADAKPRLYQISGYNVLALSGAVVAVGGEVSYVSSRRSYVTATLSESMVLELAERDEVRDIQFVTGPRAQGVTDAYAAHRVGDLADRGGQLLEDDLGAPQGTKLDGSGVVIGVISLPVNETHLATLDTHSTTNIPAYEPANAADKRLFVANASATDTAGTEDGLNMLQLIYDMAPEATVVFASPAGDSVGEMADTISLLVQGGTFDNVDVPPVNIIVDDLYFPTSNPFEVGEIEEAIDDATEDGVLYVTAAGDGGRAAVDANGTATSNVVVTNFAAQPASELGITLPDFASASVHNFGGPGILTVEEPLDDLCVFLAQDPTPVQPGEPAPFAALVSILDENDASVAIIGFQVGSPGGCLSQDFFGGVDIQTNFKVIVEDSGGADATRLAVVGVREADAALPSGTAVFDTTTPGSILGHAYSPNAVTAGAVALCNPNSLAYADDQCAPFPEIEPYSADGETLTQSRYFWRKDDEGGYAEISGGLAAAKPDVAAAGTSKVWVIDEQGNVAAQQAYYSGTSASAAVSAGIAALYWQYRQAQVAFNSDLHGTAVVPSHIAQAMRGSTLDPDLTDSADWDRNYGWGVLDAPKVLEAPLPVLDLTLTGQIGQATLNFKRSLNDASERFTYTADCGAWLTSQEVEASDALTLTPSVEQMPYTDLAAPETTIDCVVTASVTLTEGDPPQDTTYNTPSSISVTTPALLPPTVSLASSPAAVTMSFEASPLPAQQTASYAANCSLDAPETAVVLGDSNAVLPDTPYDVFATPGRILTCEVTVTVEAGDESFTATSTPITKAAGSVAQTNITLSPDSGGFRIQVNRDSNLIDPSMVPVVVTCTQGDEIIVNQTTIMGAGLSVETESLEPVSCTATASLVIDGVSTDLSDPVFTDGLDSVTPEEALPLGLPIWLLYQATQ